MSRSVRETERCQRVILGNRYRDIPSGFEGIAVKRAEIFREGPVVLVQPTTDSDGRFRDPLWFGEARLELVTETGWGFEVPAEDAA